jgi:hypothetical protein
MMMAGEIADVSKSPRHVPIHGQDIRRPLGIKGDLPEAHLLSVADFAKDDVHIFGAKKRIAGLTLTATDMDWSHGNGPEVSRRRRPAHRGIQNRHGADHNPANRRYSRCCPGSMRPLS